MQVYWNIYVKTQGLRGSFLLEKARTIRGFALEVNAGCQAWSFITQSSHRGWDGGFDDSYHAFLRVRVDPVPSCCRCCWSCQSSPLSSALKTPPTMLCHQLCFSVAITAPAASACFASSYGSCRGSMVEHVKGLVLRPLRSY